MEDQSHEAENDAFYILIFRDKHIFIPRFELFFTNHDVFFYHIMVVKNQSDKKITSWLY
jgi:hypothetical protein